MLLFFTWIIGSIGIRNFFSEKKDVIQCIVKNNNEWRTAVTNNKDDNLSTLSSNSSRQLDVFGHDCYSLGVNSAKIGVLKQANEVGFTSFLQSTDGCALETKVGFEVLGNFTNQSLEGQLADQELSTFLVTTDFTKSYSTGPMEWKSSY